MVNVPLPSTSDASRKGQRWAIHQRGHILPVFSLVVPCHAGALPVSMQRGTFTTGC